ncbi:uncharacterized protein SPPG_05720 [Spizellomyces punctatus DAOM BR117]|uniref:Lysophospholipase n=1 Tax=Spizellomyces punctatus (strain DAOM BR117) TaxID=645134 RepID=A0A0L0HCU5_SPIPD|nr:uncharacterized protein SPPG_05720 [Spizellomyces punctatus DAOM BR117]KNC98739.1 hypothetical protein SPPG_05720 [Spizellomyces punctatus DAOM BR117]|eukprot:XP_016606779.1 hypothetical protein SPPG_05720 [Spizellomyces punctatus DAOM BR117]
MDMDGSFLICLLVALITLLVTPGTSTPLHKRQLPVPSSYAPNYTECPSGSIIRSGVSVSNEERQWVQKRDTVMSELWRARNVSGVVPRVGIAISGGGYRAMLYGASIISAMSSTTPNNTSPAAGIFELSTYLSGLSGGSWLVSSLYSTSPFPTLTPQNLSHIWSLQVNLLRPTSGLIDTTEVYRDISKDVDDKYNAGFPVSITDVWGRLVGLHLNPGGEQEAAEADIKDTPLWSSVVSANEFGAAQIPYPVITTVQRSEGEAHVTVMANIWEFNVYETGSYDDSIKSFIQTKYLGTYLSNGTAQHRPENTDTRRNTSITRQPPCVTSFDQTGFLAGTSSSLFNVEVAGLGFIIETLSGILSSRGIDTALIPNPFASLPTVNGSIATPTQLELVDGGEGGQNIPLWPLVIPDRSVDLIFAVDSSNDGAGYPNGTSLIITKQYAGWKGVDTWFPPVPSTPEAFIAQGLHRKMTVFGCAGLANNGGGGGNYTGPMVIYVPNREVTYATNHSTFKLEYTMDEITGYFTNGAALMSDNPSNATAPPWSTCLPCILSAPLYRNGSATPSQDCQTCLKAHCWDGSETGTPPGAGMGPPATRGYTGQGPPPSIPFVTADNEGTANAGTRRMAGGRWWSVGFVVGVIATFLM